MPFLALIPPGFHFAPPSIPPTPISPPPAPPPGGGAALGLLKNLVKTPEVAIALGLVLLFDQPGADADLDDLLHPPDSPQNLEQPPFFGGQSPDVLYSINYELFSSEGTFQDNTSAWGPIGGIQAIITKPAPNYWVASYQLLCRGIGRFGYQANQEWLKFGQTPNIAPDLNIRILKIERADGQPDTGGNPPSTNPPIFTQPQVINPSQPKIGDRPIPQSPSQTVPPATPPIPSTPSESIGIAPAIFPTNPTSPDPQTPPAPNPTNADTNPSTGSPPSPAILVGPSSNPGTIKFIPSTPSATNIQTFTPNPDTRAPQPTPTPTTPTPTTPTPEKSDLEKTKEQLEKLIQTTGIGLVTLTQIANQTSSDALKNAAAAGTCQTLQPGGCMKPLADNASAAANNSANNGTRLDWLNTALNALDLGLLGTINNKLGTQIPNGGIGGKLSRFINWSVGDRVIGMMSMIASVHNAFMLSNNVGQTLFSIFDNLGNTGALIIKPDGDANIDSKEWLSSNLDTLFEGMLGKDLWTSIKASYRAANNIFSTSSNMYSNLRSIHNDSQELLNMVRRDTAELGNALVEEGVISEDNWDMRDPKIKIKSKMLNRLDSMNRGLEDLDNKLEAIEQLTSTLLNIAESAKEIRENTDKFGKELNEASTAFKKTRDKAIEALPDFDFDVDDLF